MLAEWPRPWLGNLASAIHSKECIAFVGAGLSREVGYPDGSGLYLRLARICVEVGQYVPQVIDEVERLARVDGASMAEWVHRQHPGEFLNVLQSIFPPRTPGDRHSGLHEVLLEIDFAGYVTTNYDMCLEDAASLRRQEFGIIEPDVYSWPDITFDVCENPTGKFIYHIHGCARDISNLVLTPSHYRAAYGGSELPKLIERLFSRYAVLFLGFSFSDYEIRRILEDLGHAYRDEQAWARARERYALISKRPEEGSTSVRQQLYHDTLKTRALFYTADDSGDSDEFGARRNHSELVNLMEQLRNDISLSYNAGHSP